MQDSRPALCSEASVQALAAHPACHVVSPPCENAEVPGRLPVPCGALQPESPGEAGTRRGGPERASGWGRQAGSRLGPQAMPFSCPMTSVQGPPPARQRWQILNTQDQLGGQGNPILSIPVPLAQTRARCLRSRPEFLSGQH